MKRNLILSLAAALSIGGMSVLAGTRMGMMTFSATSSDCEIALDGSYLPASGNGLFDVDTDSGNTVSFRATNLEKDGNDIYLVKDACLEVAGTVAGGIAYGIQSIKEVEIYTIEQNLTVEYGYADGGSVHYEGVANGFVTDGYYDFVFADEGIVAPSFLRITATDEEYISLLDITYTCEEGGQKQYVPTSKFGTYKGATQSRFEGSTYIASQDVYLTVEKQTEVTFAFGGNNYVLPAQGLVDGAYRYASGGNSVNISFGYSGVTVKGTVGGESFTMGNGNGTDFEAYIPVTSITLSASKTAFPVGSSVKLSATALPSNNSEIRAGHSEDYTWVSSNPAVATVDEIGNVTGVAAGTVRITASAPSGTKGKIDLTITDKIMVSSITFGVASSEAAPYELEAGQQVDLAAVVAPSNADNKALTWATSNSTIASVVNGVVTGKKASNNAITITATAKDGSGVSQIAYIKVVEPSASTIFTAAQAGEYTMDGGCDDYYVTDDWVLTVETDGKVTLMSDAESFITSFHYVSKSGNVYTLENDDGEADAKIDFGSSDQATFVWNYDDMYVFGSSNNYNFFK